ncbi:MAG TPA: DNA gyrase subunit A, partial [Nitrosospira sp.]
EVAAAVNFLIDNYDRLEEIEVDELVKFIPGPDFPTGGVIVGAEEIQQAYSTGRGRIILRGVAHVEELGSNRHRIVITEIPFQLNKSTLLERIADLVRSDKIEDISDLRDESDRRGMSIIIELKRGAQPKKVLNQLYKYTPLQSTFGVQMLALVNGEPRLVSLKRALQIFIQHRVEVITRRSRFELQKARDRAHILEGLLIALANLDEVIRTIRTSADADVARDNLMTRFKLSERQAQAILDMQLRRLAALERQRIEDEHRQIKERIAYLEDLLANPKKILEAIRTDLNELAEKYGDKRRTQISLEDRRDLTIEDLVPDEAIMISLTQRGYVKRVAAKAFRAQARGGRGVQGHATKDEDAVIFLTTGRTLDTVLFFSNKGKVYSEKAYQIPDADRTGKGIPIVNVLALGDNETITAAVAVSKFDENHYCTVVTRNGRIKRMALAELAAARPSGLIAINLEKGDELRWARQTSGSDEIILVTALGRAVRFPEREVRSMGRTAAGVNAIRLGKDDYLASMNVVEPHGFLALITSHGYGKRTPLEQYSTTSRGAGGVQTIDKKATAKIGEIVGARVVQESDDLMFISAGGLVLRTRVADIPSKGRATQGV